MMKIGDFAKVPHDAAASRGGRLARAVVVMLLSGAIATGHALARAQENTEVEGTDSTARVAISTTLAPAAIGPYSQAIRVGKTVYLSGQIAIDPTTNVFMTGASIQDQTQRALENLAGVLAAAGLGMDNVVATTVYLQDLNDFASMNAVYATFFKTSPPSRATIQVAGIPKGARIEISAIAVAP
jgi:2-iminobutanoate/2-iminopropanoate deaminase